MVKVNGYSSRLGIVHGKDLGIKKLYAFLTKYVQSMMQKLN